MPPDMMYYFYIPFVDLGKVMKRFMLRVNSF